MSFTLLDVDLGDAEILIRKCEYPAMLDNPLRNLMFPHSDPSTREEEIRWAVEGLQETIDTHRVELRKVSREDGTPVGFAGWSIECPTTNMSLDSRGVVERRDVNIKRGHWLPSNLDIKSWHEVTAMFKNEKKRVLRNHTNILRLNMISVDPEYQRRGVGSMLLQWGCDEADRHGRDAFVLASPAGIPLYERYGFVRVGELKTTTGTFTSMFRKSPSK